jgi:uncharacterized protein YqkB
VRMQVTETAAAELERKIGQTGALKLVFDSEGCGCAVNGVPQLRIMEERPPTSNETIVESDRYPVLIDRHHEIYFDEDLILDYRPADLAFRLKSANQIYHPSLNLTDQRQMETSQKHN